MGLFDKLKAGLTKTRDALTKNLDNLVFGKRVLDQALFEELEELMISADMGPQFTYDLIDDVKQRVKRKELQDASQIKKVLQERMIAILQKMEKPLVIPKNQPFVIMAIGVNGSGKTTTIGKLSNLLRNDGHGVLLVAADTFRAAAIEQLEVWGRRVNAPVIKQKMNADPAAVVFDAVGKIKAGFQGVVIVDTAGRLHTRTNLMEELKKVKRVISKELPGAPHEILLVLDATTGQNAVMQAKMFKEDIGATGIVLTKLDGTSKGGVVVRIAGELELPVRFIGVGEGLEDLRVFDSRDFTAALLD
ncbi:MAG TPA: signal recognition particle-docking protein FtsY [Smithellaceae bacterium]|nr:signal recognition particle-docking protein FtsY [Smithellaceae bacterium]HOG81494.1 signal recognition particle-docking protein FtsY [Smithellaceae bacterium]HQP25810.1 signal recognition particle-docking protein FtsY [Smithellaceae bacterium]